MTTVVATPVHPSTSRFRPVRQFENGADWHRALGGVPLERILFDPWPGTATEADLLRLVERGDKLCELIDGTLVEKPVGWREAIIATNLSAKLVAATEKTGSGIVSGADSTLRMISGRVRLPDVAYVSLARLPGGVVPPEPIPTLSLDLAVEVLSESNTVAEMEQKLREYFQSGTCLAWIIDPAPRTVAVYHGPEAPTRVLDQTGILDGEQVVPGFSMPVADLFRNIPPAA